jgi:hypothetical protein
LNIPDYTLERLTPEARNVLDLAQEEAGRFHHNYVGTEHLLLGLTRLDEGISATVVKNLGVNLDKVRSAVEFIIGRGDRFVMGETGLTPRAQKVIVLAIDEAKQLDQDMVGPEHLLLGLVREGEGIGAGVLESLGINLERARREILRALGRLPAESPADDAPAAAPLQPGAGMRTAMAGRRFISAAYAGGIPPLESHIGLVYHYRPWHIDAEQPKKTAVGSGAIPRPIPLSTRELTLGTLMGWVVINTGGSFTLTLYDGLAEDAPTLAVIHQPPTGATFPFHCLVRQGLTYTLEGTPGSVTIVYYDPQV